MNPPRPKVKIRVNSMSYAKLIKLLHAGLFTIPQLAEECGLGIAAVHNHTLALRREGMLRIVEWERDCRNACTLRIYKLGPGPDVKQPKMTGAERSRRWRDKKKRMQQNLVMAGKAKYVRGDNGRLRVEPV